MGSPNGPNCFFKNMSNFSYLFLGPHLMIPSHIGSIKFSLVSEGMGLVSLFLNFCWYRSVRVASSPYQQVLYE